MSSLLSSRGLSSRYRPSSGTVSPFHICSVLMAAGAISSLSDSLCCSSITWWLLVLAGNAGGRHAGGCGWLLVLAGGGDGSGSGWLRLMGAGGGYAGGLGWLAPSSIFCVIVASLLFQLGRDHCVFSISFRISPRWIFCRIALLRFGNSIRIAWIMAFLNCFECGEKLNCLELLGSWFFRIASHSIRIANHLINNNA